MQKKSIILSGRHPEHGRISVSIDKQLGDYMQIKLDADGIKLCTWMNRQIAAGNVDNSESARAAIYAEVVRPMLIKKAQD